MSEKRVVVTGRQSGKTAQLLQAAYDENATIRQQLQKAEARLEVARMAEEVWEKTMMEVIGEDGPASVADAIRKLQDQAANSIPKCDGNHGGPPCRDSECWTAPHASLEVMGNIQIDEGGELQAYYKALVITFDSVEDIRAAIDLGRCTFAFKEPS